MKRIVEIILKTFLSHYSVLNEIVILTFPNNTYLFYTTSQEFFVALRLVPDVDARCYHYCIMLTAARFYRSADASFNINVQNMIIDASFYMYICWQTQVFIYLLTSSSVCSVHKRTHFSWLAEIKSYGFLLLFWNLVGAQPESIKWSREDQALSKSHDLAPHQPHLGRMTKRDNILTGEGDQGWRRSQIIQSRESLVLHKSFNTLRCTTYQSWNFLKIYGG